MNMSCECYQRDEYVLIEDLGSSVVNAIGGGECLDGGRSGLSKSLLWANDSTRLHRPAIGFVNHLFKNLGSLEPQSTQG